MEQSEFETLKPSQTPFTFPPHRRRHLRSKTYHTLVRILSHCSDESQCSHANQVVPKNPQQGNGLNELGEATEHRVHDELTGPSSLESKNLLIERDVESSEVFGFHGRGFNQDQMEVDELDNVNKIEENEELMNNNANNLANSLEERNPSGEVVALANNQEDQFSLQEIQMQESGNAAQLQEDKEKYSSKVTEALDSSVDIEMIADSAIPHENQEEKSSSGERNASEEFEHGMQEKDMELDKSLSACGAMNSPLCATVDGEIEEGEISWDSGIYDQSLDLFLEDAVSSEAKIVDGEQTSKDIINKEEFSCKEQKGTNEKDTKLNTNLTDIINNAGNDVEVEPIEIDRIEAEYMSKIIVQGKTIEANGESWYDSNLETRRNKKQGNTAKESDLKAASLENLLPSGRISGENAAEKKETMSTEKDASLRKKKKRGPLTKERREKKKQKERIKRAENNRKLGVKRLKLQPVLKPKTVTYCRHYLKGRCQEGDKCKFSHDTIPLTKSKPCCHFARQSCMKGDDCPFDHQLSKYPCNNYVSKGSCSRGVDCMFSHEMLLKEGSPVISNVAKPELKSSSQLGNSNSRKEVKSRGTPLQNVDANSCTIGTPCKNTEQNVVETIPKPAAQVPKGINFLSFGKSTLGDTSKCNQAGSSLKVDDDVKVGHQMIHSASDLVGNSNEITKRTAGMPPRGINFLSFGKAPLDVSSSKRSCGLPSHRDYGIGKSLLGDSIKDKQAGPSPKRDDGVKVGNQTSQSASDMVQNLNEIPKRTPAVAPRGINFLSFGKAPSDDSSNNRQASLPSNGDNGVASSIQEREIASDKLQICSALPWGQPSSPLPYQSLDQLADGPGKNTPNSAQKAVLSNTANTAQKAVLSNTPSSAHTALLSTTSSSAQKALLSNTSSSAQKVLLSTLAFAARYESGIKMDRSIGAPAISADFNKETGSSENKSMRASAILDFLYGDGSKTKQ
uniref:Putative zinc finger CCCH domain-containing protein 7 isoform X1 n=1 Tax=Davidia involucrata TaxID=16924 RepID=A0A5B6YY65_DAVIN